MPICFSGIWSWRNLLEHLVQLLYFSDETKAPGGKITQLKVIQPVNEGVDTMFSNLYCEYNGKPDPIELLWRNLNEVTHSKHLSRVLSRENIVIQVVPSLPRTQISCCLPHSRSHWCPGRQVGQTLLFLFSSAHQGMPKSAELLKFSCRTSGESWLGSCYVLRECLGLLPTRTHPSWLLI